MSGIVILVIGIYLLSFYSFAIMNGIHNIDLGFNIKNMNCKYNKNYIDIGSDEKQYTSEQLYSIGSKQVIDNVHNLFKAYSFIIIGVLLILDRKDTYD